MNRAQRLVFSRSDRWTLYALSIVIMNAQTLIQEAIADRLPVAVAREVNFVADVQPIFRIHCFECHSGDTEEGGLNLSIKAKAIAGGDHGAVVVPGDSRNSLLVRLVAGMDEDRQMPPEDDKALTTEQIGVLRAWIDQGATWPDSANVIDPRRDRANTHWAFQRLHSVALPRNRAKNGWAQNEIDVFVADKFYEKGLSPSEPAKANVLVRRLYFDLIGLPPTIGQVTQFVAHSKSQPILATAELVDQLLSSRHFGERWARHWLDLARFADSDGQESDRDRPHAYHFRDFVIQAFNDDMPYDQFVRWQIAGDEYEPDSDLAVAATGFLTAGPSFKLDEKFLERERLLNRYNELDDIISTVGSGFLGLTVGCARCHDHKYDAFSAREYYQLMRVFHSGDRIRGKLPSGTDGFFFRDFDANVRATWLFRRSDFYDREIEVELGFPEILSAGVKAEEYWENAKGVAGELQSTVQRRAFAEWITDAERGGGALLARVIVNRIWQHHFGHGLVRTPSDFGVRGETPSHPELLEYLAQDFVANGWKTKRLHRKILNSAVWQQSSKPTRPHPSFASEQVGNRSETDPQNRLLWKRMPQRIEAEALRDAMLAVSGTLNLRAGGPGFKPPIPPEANLARNIQGGDYPKDAKDDASTRRRSIYMFHKRLVPYPLFQAFDRPDFLVSCARRQNTTVAPQGMALLNDRFVRAVAGDFAERLIRDCGDDDEALVQRSFQLSFSRLPIASETEASTAFIRSQMRARRMRHESDERQEAVADYCQTLFGLNEFLYVD